MTEISTLPVASAAVSVMAGFLLGMAIGSLFPSPALFVQGQMVWTVGRIFGDPLTVEYSGPGWVSSWITIGMVPAWLLFERNNRRYQRSERGNDARS